MNNDLEQGFDAWCIVEILGRKVVAGRVTEQVIAGQGFIRVDVPKTENREAFTQMYGPGSIYAITPTTEEVATLFAARNVSAPVSPYQLALPVGILSREDVVEDDGDDDPDF